MTDASRLILVDAWRQCERHLHHLRHALDSFAQMESLLVHIQPLVNAH